MDKKNSEYDLGDFYFVDEHNINDAEIEKSLLNSPGKILHVDEFIEKQYNDINYWKLPELNNLNLDDL